MKISIIICVLFAALAVSKKTTHQEKILMNIMEEIFNEPEFQSLKVNQQLEFSLAIYNILQRHFNIKEVKPKHKRKSEKRGFHIFI